MTDILERFATAEIDPASGKSFELRRPDLSEGARRPSGQALSSRRVALGAALAAAVTIAALLLTSGGADETTSPMTSNPLLVATASAAEQQSITNVEYTRSVSTYANGYAVGGGSSFLYLQRSTTETWVRPNGSGRVKITPLPGRWPSSRDKRRAEKGPIPLSQITSTRIKGSDQTLAAAALDGELTQEDLPPAAELPTDPDDLLAAFQSQYTDDLSIVRDRRVFQLATDVLMRPTAPADLRSAAYAVIAGLATVDVERDAKSPDGSRTASATIESKAGAKTTLYFDPSNSRALALTEESNGRLFSSILVNKVAEVGSLTEK